MKNNIYYTILVSTLISISIAQEQEWTLLFRQTAPFYQNISSWMEHNENDPGNDNYSILVDLEDYRGDDGKFHFKLEWPEGSSWNSGGGNIDFLPHEWKQTSNPATSTSVTGYEAIDISYTGQFWAGLELADNGSHVFIDGSVDHPNWFYALGTAQSWNNGIPAAAGPNGDTPYYSAQVVELYAYTGSACDDIDGDGICDDDEIVGCQDASACNYSANATDPGTCNIPTNCDTCNNNGTVNSNGALDGVCESCSNGSIVDNDSDNDNVCNANDVC